jgi:pilus assembly protein TadC
MDDFSTGVVGYLVATFLIVIIPYFLIYMDAKARDREALNKNEKTYKVMPVLSKKRDKNYD